MAMARGRTLTEEMVFMRTKCNRLDLIKNLNLWGNNLQNISVLQGMPNLEVLSLSVNQVNTLADLQYCPKLSELYLRKNDVSDLSEILHLKGLRQMRVLWLADNPCASVPHYRQFVLHHLPNLVKIDSRDVTDEERRQAREADFGRVALRELSSRDAESDVGEVEVLEPWEAAMEAPLEPRGVVRRGNSFEGEPRDPRERLRHGNSFESDVPPERLHGGPGQGQARGPYDHEGLERPAGNAAWAPAPPPLEGMHHIEEEHVSMRVSHGSERLLHKRPSGRYAEAYAEEGPLSPGCPPGPGQGPGPGGPGPGRYGYSGDGRGPNWQGVTRHSGPSSPGPGSPACWGAPPTGAGPWGPGTGPRGAPPPRESFPREGRCRAATAPESLDGERDPRRPNGYPGELERERGLDRGDRDARRLAMEAELRTDSWGSVVGEAAERAGRADNILCAVLALIKELDAQGLELVRRAVEQRGSEI